MANTGIIQKQQTAAVPKGKPSLADLVRKMAETGEIARALPSVITPERFTRIALSALSRSPQLQRCTKESFLGALMTAAQLGLEPNTPLGHAYLIPYKNKGVDEAQFQLGFKGLIDLAYRSGEIANIQAHEVYENDEFEFAYGSDPYLKHRPVFANRGKVIGYYGLFRTKDGASGFEVMSYEDAEKHGKKYSKTFNNGPWVTAFDEMAKKTVLKKALKYAPLKSDFMRQLNADESVRTVVGEDMLDQPAASIIDTNGEVLNYNAETGAYEPEVPTGAFGDNVVLDVPEEEER